MLKNISNLGKTLNKAEQKEIFGGKLQSIGGGGSLPYCSCSWSNGDGWSGTVSDCDQCFNHCQGGTAICTG